MKLLVALVSTLISTQVFAAGAKYNTCLFGNSSQMMLEGLNDIQVFSKIRISPRNEHRFSEVDKALILKLVSQYEEATTWDDIDEISGALQDYDYELIKMRDLNSGKVYAYVRGFPGDNEAGEVYDVATQQKVAEIGDGDMGDCSAHFTAFDKLPIKIPTMVAEATEYPKVYRCRFGDDLLGLARSKQLSFSNKVETDREYYKELNATLRDRPSRANFQLQIKTFAIQGDASEAKVMTSTAPHFALATYVDGAVETCSEVNE